ncbi:unnamed protein product [Microthlaspi erraticum]|uniref:Uncharacterized protein n=1 Tax=Microthlaspi erraticum TaxID=1685480 RepID=A0A6D2K6U1_9BRAS|nr:unnamed protein product [Microthlaspi erraticum]
MRFAISITAKRFAHRGLLVNEGNPVTASPSFSLCCWIRAFSGGSYDYREKIRGGFLNGIKLDDAIDANLRIANDLYTYNILINCFCRSSQLPLALASWEDDETWYEPSIVTFNSLLNGFCHGNRISRLSSA